jgi:predicted protein tyrosine phosphatase
MNTTFRQQTLTDKIFECTSPFDNHYQGKAKRVLFVCSAGLLRSATAATLASQMGMNARNCGSEEYALIPLSVNLIMWAKDGIFFVNEYNYLTAVDSFQFDPECTALLAKRSVVWDIPDNFEYMNPTLVSLITKEIIGLK